MSSIPQFSGCDKVGRIHRNKISSSLVSKIDTVYYYGLNKGFALKLPIMTDT